MDFIERDLEDIVFNTDVNLLSGRGLDLLYNAHTYRQLNIGNYGKSDIIQFNREIEWDYTSGDYKIKNHVINVNIIELKKDEINVDTFSFSDFTHWLRPLPNHVAISVERLSALEKCIKEIKKRYNTSFADDALELLSNLSPNK